jgi:hypothetical protein
VETWFELGTTYIDIMINYRLSQKLQLLGNGEFNHSTIIITKSNFILQEQDPYLSCIQQEEK